MAKSPTRRVENMAARIAVGCVPARRDGDVKRQLDNYQWSAIRACNIEAMTREVIDSVGVSIVFRPFYFGFARIMGSLVTRGLSPAAILAEARIQVQAWTARGLDRKILLELARMVTNLDVSEPCPSELAGVESKATE